MSVPSPVYVWLTHEEAELAALPERVDAAQMHTELAAAQGRGRAGAPDDAHYLVRAEARTRVITGYA